MSGRQFLFNIMGCVNMLMGMFTNMVPISIMGAALFLASYLIFLEPKNDDRD